MDAANVENNSIVSCTSLILGGPLMVAQWLKVLCYKSEGRWFDSSLEFFIDIILPIALWPWVRLSL
jgi:ACR3 family arsenite efflux pump ArsB